MGWDGFILGSSVMEMISWPEVGMMEGPCLVVPGALVLVAAPLLVMSVNLHDRRLCHTCVPHSIVSS